MKKIIILLFAILLVSILPYSCGYKLQKEYDQTISYADNLYALEKYSEAKSNYSKALELKPVEKYPARKIEEINAILERQMENDKYKKELRIADSLFKKQNYDEAKYAYIRANNIKQDEQLPIEMIRKIQEMQLEFQLEIEHEKQLKNNPFYLIVGSFQVESNAIRLQKELVSLGNDSRILHGLNGFQRVTLGSYPNIHDAYNRMPYAFEQGYLDVWALYQEYLN